MAHTEYQNEQWVRELKSCGDRLQLGSCIKLSGAQCVEVGHNVHIGDNAFIRGDGGLAIGDNTHISRNLLLYTINHQYEGQRLPYDDRKVRKPVKIGRNVWIGMNVCIAPGSKIGDGAIVGMGTVVSGEVPPMSIVGNQKFRILGYRDTDRYRELEASKSYGGVNGAPLQADHD